MRPTPRGLVLGVAATTVVAVTFAAGVAVGAAGGMARRAPGSSILDQAFASIAQRADAAVPASRLDAAAIQGMLATLDDRWASYDQPGSGPGSYGQLRQVLDGRYSGLGIWLRPAGTAGGVVVGSVLPGSPAAGVGLAVGDVILAVDGSPVRGLGVPEVADALRGQAGSWVHLLVGQGRLVRAVAVRRAEEPAGNVTAAAVAPGVWRIRVSVFSVGVGAEVARALARATSAGARGVVLDLRGDPGGLLSEGLATAGDFLDGGPVVTLAGRRVPSEVLDAAPGGNTTLPMAVLVDGGTASAAEVVAGALQDRGRAVLVGSRTFGKGSVQQPIALSNGSAIEITVAHYVTPDGRDINGVGLLPDVAVPPAAPPSTGLATAVAVVEGLIAAQPPRASAAQQG